MLKVTTALGTGTSPATHHQQIRERCGLKPLPGVPKQRFGDPNRASALLVSMFLPADIPRIMILSPKGGCGKTTISTTLASYFAGHGEPTVLIDFDYQGSSMRWLSARESHHPSIHGVAAYQQEAGVTRSWQFRIPSGVSRIIIDTPAAVRQQQLADLLRLPDTIAMPCPASSRISCSSARSVPTTSAWASWPTGPKKIPVFLPGYSAFCDALTFLSSVSYGKRRTM